MIVKIQKPLSRSGPEQPFYFIYNRRYSVVFRPPYPQPDIERLMQGAAKVYATAEVRGDELTIMTRTEDQPW